MQEKSLHWRRESKLMVFTYGAWCIYGKKFYDTVSCMSKRLILMDLTLISLYKQMWLDSVYAQGDTA